MDEMTEEGDLRTLVSAYLHHLNLPSAIISKIVRYDYIHSKRSLIKNLIIDVFGIKMQVFLIKISMNIIMKIIKHVLIIPKV